MAVRQKARRWLLAFAVIAAAGAAAIMLGEFPAAPAADPDALWRVVNGLCVPDEQHNGSPAPCTLVDLHQGVAKGYVLLKDLIGATQYLLIPTARVTGIEDPQLLAPGAPNYFADAWRERGYTEQAAGSRKLPRDGLSLAINSPYNRSQNQLHIHIDCLRADVRNALRRQRAAVGERWAPLAEPLAGHRYRAMRVLGENLDGADPFKLLAAQKPGAMNRQTLVVVGAEFADGRPGFLLLADQVNLAIGDRAGGEELQDHTCALAHGQE
jgi:CDP-diacylglycerol pyrophosphatase